MTVTRRSVLKSLAATAVGTVAFPGPYAGETPFPQVALYWKRLGKKIQCGLCPHECMLSNGQTGICRNRKNISGTLVPLGYGLPCAIHADPIEKKPLYHFLPGSRSFSLAVAGCNLRCKNCQNYSISQASPLETGSAYRSPRSIVDEAKASGAASIAYTYSEPTVWFEYMLDIARLARSSGLKNVLVSSGFINKAPFEELAKYLDGAHIDLKSFDDTVYRNLNAGKLAPVLDTIVSAKKKGVWVELVNLVVPEWTDDPVMIQKMCAWVRENTGEDTPVHFSRFFPLFQLAQLYPTPKDDLLKARDIAHKEKLRYVYVGNVPDIDADTRCPGCGSLLVKRDGYRVRVIGMQGPACSKCGSKIPGVWTS
jgi:pyruvate formate lyase activating enzyme